MIIWKNAVEFSWLIAHVELYKLRTKRSDQTDVESLDRSKQLFGRMYHVTRQVTKACQTYNCIVVLRIQMNMRNFERKGLWHKEREWEAEVMKRRRNHFINKRIHFPFGFHLTVLYGPVPSSNRGLHFVSNIVAIAGITKLGQGSQRN